MNQGRQKSDVVTVTLNPAIDRTLLIPNFTAGAVNRVQQEHSNPGGKGVNVAATLADYGLRVTATGFLGSENAALFEELFTLKRIEDRFVQISGPTRVGLKIADPVLHKTTDINFPGQSPDPGEIQTLMNELNSLDADLFVLSGSVPPGISPSIYAEIIAQLRDRGRRIILDTSGEPLRLGIKSKPDVVKPNIHELEEVLGERLPNCEAVIKAARTLTATGIQLVVVSMGREGACWVTTTEAVIARPPDVTIRSTVGAGDAMVAGIVAAQHHGFSLEESARLATAFSLDLLMSGVSGIRAKENLPALAAQVEIKK